MSVGIPVQSQQPYAQNLYNPTGPEIIPSGNHIQRCMMDPPRIDSDIYLTVVIRLPDRFANVDDHTNHDTLNSARTRRRN